MNIRLHSIWSVLPVPVVTIRRMPGRLVGLCLGPLVIVREDYASDWPTIVHELTHCKQFWRGLALLHLLRYYGSRRYRLKAELEAFRAEIDACEPAERRKRLHESARSLATSYSLGLDTDACRLLLSREAVPHPRRARTSLAVIESVPAVLPMRSERVERPERRGNRIDRRETTGRRTGADKRPEHNRRRQVDRRRFGLNAAGHAAAARDPSLAARAEPG